MELKQISQSCYYSLPEEYGDRPSIGYVISRKEVILIDAGNSEKQLNEFLSLIYERDLPMPTVVYLTHSHWDHTFGLSALDDSITIIATRVAGRKIETENVDLLYKAKCLAQKAIILDKDFKELVKKTNYSETEKFCLNCMHEEYDLDFSKIKIIIPNFRISYCDYKSDGGFLEEPKMIVMKTPHSDDAALYFIEKDRVLFLGDSIYENMDIDKYSRKDINNFIRPFYKRIEKLPFDIAIPSHSAAMSKEQVLKYLRKNYNID